MMTVYHGTGDYALKPIVAKGLDLRTRAYTKRKCACTTTNFKVADLFAARHTLATDFMEGKITGVVLEFLLSGTEKFDYETVRDYATHQVEDEIAVYNLKRLVLVGIHRYVDGTWIREEAIRRMA